MGAPNTSDDGDAADIAIELPPRPYPGLRPFDDDEWPIFFGRERMADAVVSQLVGGHFVVVHGDSGSGKSSLIRAGVLPRLRQEQARGGVRWRTCITLPRGGPLRNLAVALAGLDGRADDTEQVLALRRALNEGSGAPAALSELLLKDEDDHLCILIDQFEELFEYARDPAAPEARLFTDLLVAMAEAPPRGLYVALTMRSEYLGACARFAGLAEAVNRHQYLLPPMTVSDLTRAIREPALLYDGSVDADLAERLAARAAGEDGLPLVQHALMLMHREHAGAGSWRLSAAHYPEGGLAAMLSRHADAVARQAALPEAPRLVEDIFRALTKTTAENLAVRRPRTLAQLAAVTGADAAVVARAVDAFRADGTSFLTPSDARPLVPDDWIDIGHEALIRCWSALADPQRGWFVTESRDGLVWRSLLVQAESYERDAGNVLSEATTDERVRWMERRNAAWAERYGGGWERVQALIAASVRARDARRAEAAQARESELAVNLGKQRQRWAWAIASVAVLGMLIAAGFAYFASQQKLIADQERGKTAYLLEQKSSDLNGVLASLAQLKSAQRTGSVVDLRSAVEQATSQLTRTADQLALPATGAAPSASASEPAPRIYVHIGDESQRAAADAFRNQLAQRRIGDQQLLTPGVQLVPNQQNDGVLRCFRAADCSDEAVQLLKIANSLLTTPVLKLQDLSAQYESKKTLRPHHYEVWFGHQPVTLTGTAPQPKADAYASAPR